MFNWKKKIVNPIQVKLDRDSVCPGDDISSHYLEFEFDSTATISDILKKVRKINYLALIQGGKATWFILSKHTEIAIIKQQWSSPKFLIDKKTVIGDLSVEEGSVSFYFKYISTARI